MHKVDVVGVDVEVVVIVVVVVVVIVIIVVVVINLDTGHHCDNYLKSMKNVLPVKSNTLLFRRPMLFVTLVSAVLIIHGLQWTKTWVIRGKIVNEAQIQVPKDGFLNKEGTVCLNVIKKLLKLEMTSF